VDRFLTRSVLYPLADGLFGASVHGLVRELEAFKRLSPEALRKRQWLRLKDLIRHAHRTTAYYRRVRDEAGLYFSHYRQAPRLRERVWHGLTGRRYFPHGPLLAHDGQAVADLLDRWRPDGVFGVPALTSGPGTVEGP
jgi:cytosine/adenosine deaminase-related metal-dependent hydrolase